MKDHTPQFLLIVRERLRAGSGEAYDKNERQLAAACAGLNCPHPYLALLSTADPKEVWWFNAFRSREERDGLDEAYAQNEALMTELRRLGKRKEELRESVASTMTEYQPHLSHGATLRIAGARFFVINVTQAEGGPPGAVFDSSEGERFVIILAADRALAESIAARSGTSAIVLAVQPQWSFPDQAWVAADSEFWGSQITY